MLKDSFPLSPSFDGRPIAREIWQRYRQTDLSFYRLTPEQFHQVVTIFETHCTHPNGIMTVRLLPILRDLGIEAPVHEILDMLANLDTNGELTFEEFLCWWTGVESQPAEPRPISPDLTSGPLQLMESILKSAPDLSSLVEADKMSDTSQESRESRDSREGSLVCGISPDAPRCIAGTPATTVTIAGILREKVARFKLATPARVLALSRSNSTPISNPTEGAWTPSPVPFVTH